MKNLLLILVILITGIINAQDCNPNICDGCCDVFEPETTEFDFNIDNCDIDFEAVKIELNDIVTLFFTELTEYNYNYGQPYGTNAPYYPFSDVVSSNYNITIETFPFIYGAVADVSISPGVVTDVIININEDKYHELTQDEFDGDDTSYNNGNVRALAYLKKRMVIFHELGHVLGLDHPCNTELDIMNTSLCLRGDDPNSTLSFPDDFPVENITTFENAMFRMFKGTRAGQVFFPESSSTTSSSSSSAAATNPSQSSAGAQPLTQTEDANAAEAAEAAKLELYGDTDLTDAQLQNRIDAIEGISDAFVTVEYGWDSGQQQYIILLSDGLSPPIISETAAIPNLTTITYLEFKDRLQWTIDWRNDFISKIANNHLGG